MPDKELNYFTREDGSNASPSEVRDFLKSELYKGKKYLTLGECDNQTPEGRCAGHLEPAKDHKASTTKKEE